MRIKTHGDRHRQFSTMRVSAWSDKRDGPDLGAVAALVYTVIFYPGLQ